MASAAVTSKKTKSPTANKNYSTNLAKGGSVTVKDGVKTYSDKALNVTGKGGISISGKDYSRDKGGTGFAPKTTVITADAMKPVTPVPLATPAPVDGLGTTTAQGSASLAAKMGGTYDIKSGTITPPPPPAEPTKTGMDAYTEMFNAQNAALKSAGEDRFSYEDAFNKTQKQLRPKEGLVNSIAGQLNVIQEKSNAAQLALEGQGRGQTGSFVGGEQARISREAAIQSMPLQAQLAIAQDDLDSARSYYTQYYQAKMQDSQNEYNLKKENIQNLYGFLTAQEERKAAASEKVLDRQYAESQQLMTAKAEMISKALGQGAPAAVQQAIDSATTLAGVATAAGKYNGDLLAQEAQRANIAQSYSSIATDKLQQQKLLAELNPDNSVSNGDLAAYGQQFAETGKLPSVSELKQSGLSVSQVTEYAKQTPKPAGSILSTNTGIKSSSISPSQEDGILALYDIQKKVADLKALDEKRQQGVSSAIVGKLFGSEDQQRYIDLRGEIVDLLARARTGAALTTQEENFYASQLPGRIGQVGVIPGTNLGLFGNNSQNRIDNFGTKIQGTLDTKLSGTGTVIQGYSQVDVPQLGKKTVGEVVNIGDTQYRVLPDGTLTDII